MDIINFIYDIISSPVSWLAWMLFLFGYEWTPKTETDEVVEEHINELQTKKVDKDAERIGAGGRPKPVETLDVKGGIKLHDRTPQAVVTFTIDDNNAPTDWDDLFAAKGVPGVAAPYTDQIAGDDKAPWLALQTAGWEIASHSKTHAHMLEFTEEQLEEEIGGSKILLESWGFNVRNYVYPYGESNDLIEKIVRSHYLGAAKVTGGPATRPFPMQTLGRVDGDALTIGQLEAKVDETISREGWMIVMLHHSDAPKLTKIGDLIDYIVAAGVEILTMSEAEDLTGNIVESKYFKIGAEGESVIGLPLRNLLPNSELGVWSRSDANKGLCTIAYDNGDKGAGAAPSVGDACVGDNGATGVVISYTIADGDWDLGTAEGVFTLGSCTGSWTDNEGLTFDGVETALVNGEAIGICNDPCNDDDTGDWTDTDSILAHGGDGFYTVTTDADEKAYLAGLTFTEGKIYKVEAQLKDGTASPTDIELVSLDGAVVEKACAPINTTGSFVTYSLAFKATAGTDGVGIRTPTSLGGSNIQMRYFICYEITPCKTDLLGLDDWKLATTMHAYRQHDDATYTKEGSFYSIKLVPTAASDWMQWPSLTTLRVKEFAGRTVTFGVWVYASVADHVQLRARDNTGYGASAFHSGTPGWEWLEATRSFPVDITTVYMNIFAFLAPNTDGSTVFYLSQPMLTFGRLIGQGNYQPRQGEWVRCQKAIPLSTLNNKAGFTDVAWATLNIEAESEGMIPQEAKALLIGGSVNDDGSAGADCYLVFRKDGTLGEQLYFSPYGLVNDAIHRGQGIIYLDDAGDLQYKIVATDGNFDIPRLKVYGIQVS